MRGGESVRGRRECEGEGRECEGRRECEGEESVRGRRV